YFKNEAIPWAWEFLTSKEWLAIPEELLWPSVYEEDDEAYELWNKVIGVPAERITRLGKADNFWEHGSGPCGPCSEIYFDRGEKYGCGSPNCRPGCDCDRFMEIWNNVFSQFNNDGNGNYTELAKKNIDTGMGLERLACVMQGVDNMFEVDSIRKVLDSVCAIAGKSYGKDADNDVSIRVITDHVRSATFMISDGVIPSNEGRGYVLRRILRRACRHGKLLGIERRFLPELCEVAIGESADAYPALREKRDYILKVISLEEERFNATIDAGLSILSELIERAKGNGKTLLDGADAFKLYDTYGFPYDLTREIAEEAGLSLDEAGFRALMEEQRVRARAARGNISGWSDSEKSLLNDLPKTDFVGYTENETEARVLAILSDDRTVDSVNEGECTVILDRTVFYGEGGGQVGDTGMLTADGVALTVNDTKKSDGVYIHLCTLETGVLKAGDSVRARIDIDRRTAIRRNHSACHLLQAALRAVLGSHVEQAGSYVDEARLRFDFSHFAALTAEELSRVEALVNAHILAAEAGKTLVTDMETAKAHGAMALFGEKYGAEVRMVKLGDFSTELCGGTHVSSTGEIGLFKILSESSVAAGVRRIEATTACGVLSLLAEKDALIAATARELKAANPADLSKRASAVVDENRELRRALDSANAKLANAKLDSLLASAEAVGALRLLTAKLEMRPDEARGMCDTIKEKYPDMVAVFAVTFDGKLNFVACCGAAAVKAGAHAGNILKSISAIAGGKGGGRPDSAMSGGRDLDKIDEALAAVKNLL
ncbi:MAG: alanine--tRNA ligase, partial [Clostridia bacterium]|nr:alanine--tRNA ligase [Clostridia bacterium]